MCQSAAVDLSSVWDTILRECLQRKESGWQMIDTQTQPQAASTTQVGERNSPILSSRLVELCPAYIELVDHGTREQQGEERTRAHNALIEQMVREKIVEPSPH